MHETAGTGAKMHLLVDPWADCLEIARAERARNPQFADVRDRLGALLLEHGRADEACQEFDAALEINPRYWLARFHRYVAVRVRDGRLDDDAQASGLWEHVEEPDRGVWLAWFHAQRGEIDEACKVLDELGSEPRFAALAAFHRAVYLRGLGDRARVRDELRVCALADPVYRRILESRRWISPYGSTTAKGLQDPFAIVATADAATWNPASGSVYEQLGAHCAAHGALEQSEACFEDAFLRHGRESLHQVRMASVALGRGDEESAVSCLRRAIEVDPTSVEARIALGFEYQSQGFHRDALVQFEVAARLQPTFPDVQYNLGLLYQAQDRGDDAQRCLERALEINPRYFQARTSLAQLLLHSKRYEAALDVLDPLESTQIRSADLLVQKAEAHLALAQYAAALRALERAAEINPDFPRSYYVLGELHRAQGLKRKAQEAWKQYLERSRRWKEEHPTLEGEDEIS